MNDILHYIYLKITDLHTKHVLLIFINIYGKICDVTNSYSPTDVDKLFRAEKPAFSAQNKHVNKVYSGGYNKEMFPSLTFC